MLVVFLSIFVADTKMIFRYDFVAPLNQPTWIMSPFKMIILLFACLSALLKSAL